MSCDTFLMLKNALVLQETEKAVKICVRVSGRHENGESYEGTQNLWIPKAVCYQKNEDIYVLDEFLIKKEDEISAQYHLSLCGIAVEEEDA